LALYFFWRKNIGAKDARKMLMKLTDDLTIFFALSGSVRTKAAHRMLMKSTSGSNPKKRKP